MSKTLETESKVDENLDFSLLFGAFHAASVEQDKEPLFKIAVIGEEFAQPCRCCGGQPSVHIANFKDKEKHPSNVYVCCSHCSSCDGKWYDDKETALAEWNNRNMASAPRTDTREDIYDFAKRIVSNVKFSE